MHVEAIVRKIADAHDGGAESLPPERMQFIRDRAEAFCASPVRDAETWVATGVSPTRRELKGQGLDRRRNAELRTHLDKARAVYVKMFGFSVPCAEAVAALRKLGPLVEIGAGTGYWSAILAANGHDVVATDPVPGRSHYGFNIGAHYPVVQLFGNAAVRHYPERDVLCSWPCSRVTWAMDAARQIAAPRHFAYIGEGRGGQTGDNGLFDLLEAAFDRIATIPLPQFSGCKDRLTIYRRR